jgi:serine protease Do
MSLRDYASPSVSRNKDRRQRWLSAITALTLLLSPLSPLLITQPALAAAPAPVQQEGEAVTTLDGVESAVIQIEAEGVFMEPGEGAAVSGGTGSGFIIDPEGIAVTNNHVVTGGALFKVYVSGQDEPVNAKLLGVSECADLAVIDLEGGGYPFLTWHEGSIKVGLDVYAAGFPLGDPEFTLTRGIIAKAKADGESSWASVDGVLQHDATINPGNSGGPLVDADGAIVGVNYAGDDENNQYFAISKEYAIDIVDTLASGEDLDSLGINGEAFYDEETESSGIYVYSVASGSAADDAGIEAGDIVTSLEGLPLAEDGTMATYCEIIRSHSPDDVLGVEVYRSDTDELLEGQINGRPLETSFSFAEEIDPGSAPVAEGEGYTEYVEVSHSDGVFSMELPVEWDDIQENEWVRGEDEDEKTVGIRLDASPNLDDFYDDWGIPGVIARYSESLPNELTLEELLDSFDYSDICESDGREELSPGYFSGFFDFWKNCDGNEGADAIVLALTPAETNAYYVILEIYTASAADVEASDRILDTFIVYDDQPVDETNMLSNEGELLTDVDTSSLEYDYVQISDPAIVALVPDAYGEVDSSVWTNSDGEAIGRIATIAPNIDDFNNNWTTPGMVIKSAVDLQ